jgi:2,5-diamino-6-(ribosylamino)-4(3H)-pyrimidinone 5'-phosphate reductase
VAAYYDLIPTWEEDLTLCGSETILAAQPAPDDPDAGPVPDADVGDRRPVLAIVDSRGRVRSWGALLGAPHWRAGLAICSASIPAEHLAYLDRRKVDVLVAGDDRVDLKAALAALSDRAVTTVRIDAGPTLTTLAVREGLVDEVSLLAHPVLADTGRPFVDELDAAVELRLVASEERAAGLVWLRYAVVR